MHAWQRRTAGAVVAAVGVTFIAVVIVNRLFAVGPAFERMSDGFRPNMKPAPIGQLQKDLNGLSAVRTEFDAKGVPMLAQALKLSPEQFRGLMVRRYPDVARGMDQLPSVVSQFRGVVGTLQAEQGRFARADAIPTSNLPATTVPWGLLAAGIVLMGLGLLVAIRPRGIGAGLVVALGLLLVAAPLGLSLPQKASAADSMNDHLKPVYTVQMLTGARGALATVGLMGQQMQTKMLPDLGRQLGMDQAELHAFFRRNLPVMAAAMQTMPQSMGRFQSLLKTFDGHLADFDTLTSVAFVPIVWTMIGGGAVALLAGLWGLLLVGAKPAMEEARPVLLKAA